jgi:hypothetical protein
VTRQVPTADSSVSLPTLALGLLLVRRPPTRPDPSCSEGVTAVGFAAIERAAINGLPAPSNASGVPAGDVHHHVYRSKGVLDLNGPTWQRFSAGRGESRRTDQVGHFQRAARPPGRSRPITGDSSFIRRFRRHP